MTYRVADLVGRYRVKVAVDERGLHALHFEQPAVDERGLHALHFEQPASPQRVPGPPPNPGHESVTLVLVDSNRLIAHQPNRQPAEFRRIA